MYNADCPCQNGGSCSYISNTINCLCAQGFTGNSCETCKCLLQLNDVDNGNALFIAHNYSLAHAPMDLRPN